MTHKQDHSLRPSPKGLYSMPLRSTHHLGANTYLLVLEFPAGKMLPPMKAGQFVNVAVPHGEVLLRRPISICYVDAERNHLWLLVAAVGEGTKQIVKTRVGEELNLLAPLGNGFDTEHSQHPLLIGGGVGIAPMLYLASVFHSRGILPHILLGGRTREHLVLLDEFARYGEVHLTTDDGSLGVHGRVTQHPILEEGVFDQVFCCGPKPMMVAVKQWAESRQIECELSLENTMACGIGACLCCVENTLDQGNVCVCTEGPVFNSKRIQW